MENEIKVNEFVRTKYGEIAKVIEYKDEIVFDKEIKFYGMYRGYICEDELDFIVKHSPNLIDLICEGDYVNGKEVIEVFSDSVFVLAYNIKSADNIEQIYINQIKKIVTHEQFESISYKVTKM